MAGVQFEPVERVLDEPGGGTWPPLAIPSSRSWTGSGWTGSGRGGGILYIYGTSSSGLMAPPVPSSYI